MTPKEKAEELVKKCYNNATDFIDSNKAAKEASIIFSLIVVNEIMEIKSVERDIKLYNFWWSVVQELEKMN